jgi:hypothetical protein
MTPGRKPVIDWKKFDAKLGKMSDGDLARIIGGGVSSFAVLARRRKLGIRSFAPRNGFDRKGRRLQSVG